MPRARRNTAAARKICDHGDPVFIHSWNSGNPGAGAGADTIYEFEGQMAVASSEYDEVHGPYDDLPSLFKAHPNLLTVTEATESIESAYLKAADVVAMLSFWAPPPDPDFERLLPLLSSVTLPKRTPGFTVNGERWTHTKGQRFRRAPDEPGDSR